MSRLAFGAMVALGMFVAASGGVAGDRGGRSGTRADGLIGRAGTYASPDGSCGVSLETASMGGFLVLTGRNSGAAKLRVDDLTGMAWVHGHTLVYTTSPIYGVPGVYVYDCDSDKSKRVVAPRTVTKAYPDGEDYFELKRVSGQGRATAYFYYAPNVDKVDFSIFRTPAFLYEVHLDGSGFRRVKSPTK